MPPLGTPLPSATVATNTVEGVVITATRTPELLRTVPESVSVISSAQIRATPAQGLDDILQLEPGINLDAFGPFASLQRVDAGPVYHGDAGAGAHRRRPLTLTPSLGRLGPEHPVC